MSTRVPCLALALALGACSAEEMAPVPRDARRPAAEPQSRTGCPTSRVDAKPAIVELASYAHTTCALDATGAIYCWGDNDRGQALVPHRDGRIFYPQRSWVEACFAHIAMGAKHGCGLLLDGRAACWGDSTAGEAGIGNPHGGARVYEAIQGLDGIVQAGVGAALRADGTVWTWGLLSWNNWGEPPQIIPSLNAGALPTDGPARCSITAERTVVCYGNNWFGQAGQRPGPVQVTRTREVIGLPRGVDEVVVGFSKVCAMVSGRVWCWGDGPLGHGEPGFSGVAREVPQVSTVISIGVGRHICAAEEDGDLWCWGRNADGQSGLPPSGDLLTPARVIGLPPVRSVVAGFSHTCALTVDAEVYCWGLNNDGQLGVGHEPSSTHIPQRVDIPIETP